MPEHNELDVEHPRIAEYTKNMIRQGRSVEEIVKVVGMPHEVVERYKRDVVREDKFK